MEGMSQWYGIRFLRKQVVFLFSALAVMAALCAGCGGSSADDQAVHDYAKWTYMVYAAADSDISEAAKLDIDEMETVGSGPDVTIVVQVDFSPSDSPSDTSRGMVIQDDNQGEIVSDLVSIGKKNMTDPQTLSEFIRWAAATYPAEHYALVLWSHGSGWKSLDPAPAVAKGMIVDTSDAPGEIMSLQDIAGAVRQSGVDLDLINFDTCLMGMYEVAYEFRGLARAITFSEERYPVFGDPYDDILRELSLNPDMDARELAQVITARCRDFYVSAGIPMTKSALDLAYIDEFHAGISDLARGMIEAMDTQRDTIQAARNDSVSYDFPENHDLGDFLAILSGTTDSIELQDAIGQVQEVMSDLIISDAAYSPLPIDGLYRSQGLAVFLPKSSQVSESDLDAYSYLACNEPSASPTWGDFVELLVSGDTTLSEPSAQGGFTVRIEWDTEADLDLYIVEPGGTIASPVLGPSSGAYGECSLDSNESLVSLEYYVADENVETGAYDIWVRFYGDDPSLSGPTTVSWYILDPVNGINEYTLEAQTVMDLENQVPSGWSGSETEMRSLMNNEYSNWWYAGTLAR